jgi:DNA modification methylase
MITTTHEIVIANSNNLEFVPKNSIALVVTSPPYPMIEMWDDSFKLQNPEIGKAIEDYNGPEAFELMHRELDNVWNELYRVLIDGGIACINIGDATRKIGNKFQLYSNNSRIISYCFKIGFDTLPVILWRKQTNAPNKFMGSGMLPAGAYVTLEHEYVLILRKKGKRNFRTDEEKRNRHQSAYFWEERNNWFSDIWDFKGIKQNINHQDVRTRSAAFPFELAYRLINMYSVRGDKILDPFLGTGTTMYAAIASCRNSIGVEIESSFEGLIKAQAHKVVSVLNDYIQERLKKHLDFVDDYNNIKGPLKYTNIHHKFPVMTSQEVNMLVNFVEKIEKKDERTFFITYLEQPTFQKPYFSELKDLAGEIEDQQLKLTF